MSKLIGVIKPPTQIKVEIVGSGARGIPGQSTYELWLEQGNVGSEEDFLLSLKGEKGDIPSITHLEEAITQAINSINTTNNFIIEQEQQRVLAEQQRQKNKIVVSDTEPTDSIFWLDTSQN